MLGRFRDATELAITVFSLTLEAGRLTLDDASHLSRSTSVTGNIASLEGLLSGACSGH